MSAAGTVDSKKIGRHNGCLGKFNRNIAYPSPEDKLLYIGHIEKSKLSTTTRYSINVEKIREWNHPQESYGVSTVQPGIYPLRVNTKDGEQQTIRIKKLL